MPSTTATRACGYDKYARRYLGGFCFRFNRRFSMVAMTEPPLPGKLTPLHLDHFFHQGA
jgi:hypothetical protein